MLDRAVIVPKAFANMPSEAQAARMFCAAGLRLLDWLLQNGVILEDLDRSLGRALAAATIEWPDKYRRQALELLDAIRKNHRLVGVLLDQNPAAAPCDSDTCSRCMQIFEKYQPEIVAFAGNCSGCAPERFSESAIDFTDYNGLIQDSAVQLNDGEWDVKCFEERILKPLFRHTKHVKICDPYLGRGQQGGNPQASWNKYRIALEWIVSAFANHAINASVGDIEIYTELAMNVNYDNVEPLTHRLRTLGNDLRHLIGIPVTVFPKRGREHRPFPHARYLITDQTALLVERGFDLLWDDQKMHRHGLDPTINPRKLRDVMIATYQQPSRIEAYFRSLCDVL